MTTSDKVAIAAFFVSVISAFVAIWGVSVSSRAMKLAERQDKDSNSQQFERLRTEVLNMIADSGRQLEAARIDLGALRAGFAAEPQPVQVMLGSYRESLFDSYLPKIEAAVHQLDQLWQSVIAWQSSMPHGEIQAMKALVHRSHRDDETVCGVAKAMAAEYQEKLRAARVYVGHATR